MRLCVLCAWLMVIAGCSGSRENATELVAISYAGDAQIPHRTFLADPFEAKHKDIFVRLVPSESEDVVAQIKASGGAPAYDVIPLGEPRQITAVEEGWIEQTPRAELSNLKDVHPQFVSACRDYGVPETYSLIGLAYNPELVPAPTSWSDLWKPEYRGKIGITSPGSNLGFGFVVAVAKLFGGSEENLEPAWAKLKQLEPFQVAPNPTALAQLFERQEIAIAPLWNNDAAILRGKGLAVKFRKPLPGSVLVVSCLDVIKGSAQTKLAREYINDVISEDYQAQAAAAPFFFGPTNRKVPTPESSFEYLLANANEFAGILQVNWVKAARVRGAATDRFNREFSR